MSNAPHIPWDPSLPPRPDWVTYFEAIAQAVSARGDCMRAQVGAVITTPEHFILSTGYNGFTAGMEGCREQPRSCLRGQWANNFHSSSKPLLVQHMVDTLSCESTHAEDNAIQTARRLGHQLQGATMYVTRLPCRQCVTKAQAHGITTIYAEGRRLNIS